MRTLELDAIMLKLQSSSKVLGTLNKIPFTGGSWRRNHGGGPTMYHHLEKLTRMIFWPGGRPAEAGWEGGVRLVRVPKYNVTMANTAELQNYLMIMI